MMKKVSKEAYLKELEDSLTKARSSSETLCMVFERVKPDLSIRFDWLTEQLTDLQTELADFKQGV